MSLAHVFQEFSSAVQSLTIMSSLPAARLAAHVARPPIDHGNERLLSSDRRAGTEWNL
jgi:hypothetical protein